MSQMELFNHLLKIIIISHLKPYSYIQIVRIRYKYIINKITNIKLQYFI